MAKPDCEDGWFKRAVELEAALAFADFTRLARTLLRYVFLQIYGRGERPKLAYLPQKDIAMRIGQKKQNVQRAIRELVESRVLVEVRDDQYRFVKDYATWVKWDRNTGASGQPRLTAKEAEDCRKAPAFARAFQLDGDADPACASGFLSALTESSIGMTESSIGMTGVIHRDDSQSSIGMTESSIGMTGAIEERAHGIEFRRREKREGRENSPPENLSPRQGNSRLTEAENARLMREFLDMEAAMAERRSR